MLTAATNSKNGVGCPAFPRSLAVRGLFGVRPAVSDAHHGLGSAVGAAEPRCRTDQLRNLLADVPQKGAAGSHHLGRASTRSTLNTAASSR
jgi:transposase-like protein